MIVHIPHHEYFPMPLKSHAILSINVGFKDFPQPFHRMTSEPRMSEVGIKQAECLIHFHLYGLRQSFILPGEPLGKLNRHCRLSLTSFS